jgi:hypothetical protein
MFGREPAAWLAAINAVLACAMGFGLDLTGEQMALRVNHEHLFRQ